MSEALATVDNTGERYWEAELHRRKGELLLMQQGQKVWEAEECFRQALDIARRQQAKSPELRAAMSLSRLLQHQGKQEEAHHLLADSTPGPDQPANYRPWYTSRFADINSVSFYWRDHYDELRKESLRFSECFYDSTLPPEVTEAVAANLTILKSPMVLRQADARLWSWEGCNDDRGCCHGSCTHVWNYAQAIPHLFPNLERTLRETEYGPSQSEAGHQTFRSSLPIRPVDHDFHAAADGQLGGIMKVYRDWRISGDTEWLRGLWPKIRKSLDYCIETWDPAHKGWLEEPHHNTYDIEFWGPDGMCTSFYLGALTAATLMAKTLGDSVPRYGELLKKGLERTETELFDGEYSAKGSALGWMTFSHEDASDISGILSWIKPRMPTSMHYPLGFTNGHEVVGSRYVAPGTTNRVLNFTNAMVAFRGGNLPQTFTNHVLLTANNQVMNLSSNKLTMTVTLFTGLFNGSVMDTNTGKTISFNGALAPETQRRLRLFPRDESERRGSATRELDVAHVTQFWKTR